VCPCWIDWDIVDDDGNVPELEIGIVDVDMDGGLTIHLGTSLLKFLLASGIELLSQGFNSSMPFSKTFISSET
jgi:hypothetical protein